ncbi:MAG: GGDEF domain-containing protein [Gammaproteobacteria bacterium]
MSSEKGVQAGSVGKVLRLLGALRQSQAGHVVYRQVQMLLDDMVMSQQTSERAYLTAINQLLDAFCQHLKKGSPLQMQVRMLEARLQLPMTASDMEALRNYADLYSRQIEGLDSLDTELFREAIAPLLEFFGITDPGSASLDSPHKASEDPQTEGSTHSVRQAERENKNEATGDETTGQWPLTRSIDPLPAREDKAGHSLAGHELADQQEEDESSTPVIQSGLVLQVQETINQNKEFSRLLELIQSDIQKAGNRKELEDMRWALVREIETLRKEHSKLTERLDGAHAYIGTVEANSLQLTDELRRVRLLSVTDELTDLPNRRAFLQRLEDEVARVQRYNFPLSLALIDIDFFKKVNDKYGHPGGDEVLRLYSRKILSVFRHHDLVARYGGEEFAVLMPNTEVDGATRALEKVMERAMSTFWIFEGEKVAAPTFSAGLAFYKSGETASAFIERSDKALYQAKNKGRNRIEVDSSYSSIEQEQDAPDR